MSWWSRFVRRASLDDELARELEDHLERRTQALTAAGLAPAQARRQAVLESGGAEQAKEAVRDVRGTRWAHDFLQDVRYGVRGGRKHPGLLAAAVLSMGLGIGANTAIFSLVDAVLLRMLPVHRPEELAVLGGGSYTYPLWEEIRRHMKGRVAGTLAWADERLDQGSGGEADPVDALMVSGEFFELLGLRPALGRVLTPADDRRGGGPDGPTVVLSERFWERRFQRNPAVVGRTLALNGVAFTIVGVLPARFAGPIVGRSFDVAAPLGTIDLVRTGGPESLLDGRATWWLNIMLRLRPDQSIDAATAALRGVQPQIRAATLPQKWPAEFLARYITEPFELAPASTGLSELRRHYREPLLVLVGIVALVLVVACANVANLLLARAAARRHELAARLALGASHGRLIRQLLTESLVLAVPGAAAGLALAVWGARFLVSQLSTSEQPVTLALPLDWRLLGFLTLLTMLTAIGFGLAPAWRSRRLDAADAVTHATGRVTRRGAASGPLVVGQIALSLVLVVAAGLFGRTFSTLATRDIGLEPDHLQVAFIEAGRVPTQARARLYAEAQAAARAVPGVQAAAASMIGPLSGMGWNTRVEVPGQAAKRGREAMTYMNAVTPGWFATYGTRLVAGRDVEPSDQTGPSVGLVNERFAQHFFGQAAPVGRRLRLETGPGVFTDVEIIGVVENAAYRGVREDFPPTLYRPTGQVDDLPPFITLTVKTAPGGALGLQPALTRALLAVDPRLGITYTSMADRIHDQLTEVRTVALLSGFFGGLALLLAAIGLYGVTSYGVNERRREIGIRLTLGAGRAAAERFVLGGVARLVAVGVVLGLGVSVALSPVVQKLLYQLEPRDPATMVLAAVSLAGVGLLAGWLPARRAARIDPARVLREG